MLHYHHGSGGGGGVDTRRNMSISMGWPNTVTVHSASAVNYRVAVITIL